MSFRMKLFFPSALLLCVASTASVAADIDEDGLDDLYEQDIINAFRPILFYDAQEDHWPSTLIWMTEHADLRWNGQLVYGQPALGNDPLLMLQGSSVTGASSSVLGTPSDSAYRMGLHPSLWGGQGPIPVGTYARVTPVLGSLIYATQGGNQIVINLNPGDVLLQYWQFFPANDNQAGFPGCDDIGDHTCDWIWLDLIITSGPVSPASVKYIVYHHHGDGNCTPTVLSSGHPWFPADGVPRCYLEESTHEPWAQPSGAGEESCTFGTGFGVADHDGNGVTYRTQNVLNVGEVWASMPDVEARLFLHFNGRWGEWAAHCFAHTDEPAVSPVFQLWPSAYRPDYASATLTVPHAYVYVQPSAPAWTQFGLGSRYHPRQSLADAADQVQEGGTIRVAIGETISTPVTITTPMTIEGYTP